MFPFAGMPVWAQYLGEGPAADPLHPHRPRHHAEGRAPSNLQYDTIALIALMLNRDDDRRDALPSHARLRLYAHRHSGAMRSIEPGISRFRVRRFACLRNDKRHRCLGSGARRQKSKTRVSADFQRALMQEVMKTELLRIKALIAPPRCSPSSSGPSTSSHPKR
jgi:hypothetical protein